MRCSKWAAEGGGNGREPQYLPTHCQRYGADGVLAPGRAAAEAASKVVPQEMYFLSLLPLGERGFFYWRLNYEANGETMAPLTKEAVHIPSSNQKE